MKPFVIAALAVAAFAAPGHAQDNWPQRPIELLVPFPAGTTTDIVARVVANDLSAQLGQPIVVENRPGGSGAIAMNAVANAAPDGYTIGLGTTTTQAVSISMNLDLPYDPEADFAHVAMVGGVPYVLVVNPSVGVDSLEGLIEKARAEPGTLTYGSVGEASLANLATVLLSSQSGIDLIHVPYSAAGQVALDNVAGRVDMQLSTYGSLQGFIQEGQLIPLAVSSQRRMTELPDIPTIDESGVEGYDAELWFAVVAPAGTPDAIVERLNAAINEGLAKAEVASALLGQGVEVDPGSPQDLAERVSSDIVKWREVLEIAGIEPQ